MPDRINLKKAKEMLEILKFEAKTEEEMDAYNYLVKFLVDVEFLKEAYQTAQSILVMQRKDIGD